MDELLPVSQGSSQWFHLGLTLVDSLDTLQLMGLEKEYSEARTWVDSHLQVKPCFASPLIVAAKKMACWTHDYPCQASESS